MDTVLTIVLTVVVYSLILVAFVGRRDLGKRRKPQQPQPVPSMVDSKPRTEGWIAHMQYGTRVWIPRKYTQYGGDESRHYITEAWFAGTLHETEAECKIDCAQRNLDDAERLMKAATGV